MSKFSARQPRRSPFGAIVLLILVALATIFFLKIYPQMAHRRFGQFDRFNLVILSPQVTLVSLATHRPEAAVISFPDDLYLPEVVHGYGKYPANRVYSVGQLDNRGGETLAGSVREYLGVPVDGYWVPSQRVSSLPSYFINPQHLFSGQSDLGLLDRLQFALALVQLRADKIKTVDLARLASPLVLADGSRGQIVEKDTLDNALQGLFFEDSLRQENLRLAVINSTAVSGLGNRAARLLTNIGGSVVEVSSSQTALPGCQIITSRQTSTQATIRRAAQIFSCQLVLKEETGRTDGQIILGEDYVSWLAK